MIDREKVIRAWECCNPFNRKCNECPYEKDCYHDGISRHMVGEAVVLLKDDETQLQYRDDHIAMYQAEINRLEALLKEQEAVKPKSKVRHGANAQIQHFCGNCNTVLHGKPKYCSECGRSVKWE